MSTTFANSINGNEIYAARAVADKDGNQIDTTYAKASTLATVATSGDYDDLTNKPTIPAAQVNSDWNSSSGVSQILNKPTLATVATSGDYDDLTNKPTIPAAQVNSDWNASSGVAQILNKPTLATVATTGNYSDLNGAPSLATVATTGNYDDLTNKPSIPAAQVNSDWNASSGVSEILNKPTLATVATSGDYDDLTNKPSIPAALSAGNGIDITSNVVSAKVDGTTVGVNTNGELEVIGGAGVDMSAHIPIQLSESGDNIGLSYNPLFFDYISYGKVVPLQASTNGGSFSRLTCPWTFGYKEADNSVNIIVERFDSNASSCIPYWFPTSINTSTASSAPRLKVLSSNPEYKYQTTTCYRPSGTVNQYSTYTVYNIPTPPGVGPDFNFDTTKFEVLGDWTSITSPVVSWYLGFTTANDVWTSNGLLYFPENSMLGVRWGDKGLDLKLKSNGGIAVNGAGLYVENPLPASTSSDADKVLTVDSNGEAGWATPAAQVNADWNSSSGVSEILNKPTLATVATTGAYSDLSGTPTLATVATSGDYTDLSNKPTIRNVPASTSSDATKVLTVDSNGDAGWAAPAGLFIAEYGTTTYQEVLDAYNANKIVYCRVPGSQTAYKKMAFLAFVNKNESTPSNSNFEFQYYKSVSSHTASQQGDQVEIYKVAYNSTWTTTIREAASKVVAGTHMSQSYSSGTLTLNATWPTVDQTYDSTSTNAQSGTAVAGALANFALGDVSSIQQVNALPANPDASTLYLIPVT